MKLLKKKILFVSLSSMLASSSAFAKMYLNSMCYMKETSAGKVIEGDKNKSTKFPLASISKLVTSLWAVEKLGPNYRFRTRLHVVKNGNDAYDIHIEGSRDPIMGRNASYFIISELNRLKIKKIENLTFDENFLLDWLAEEKPRIGGETPYYDTLEKQADAVRKNLVGSFATAVRADTYNGLKAQATKAGVPMGPLPTLSVRRVEFKPKINFAKTKDTVTYIYQSAPLHNILKRMNNQSNNYIADTLYWNLGGTAQFNNFVKSLSLSTKEIEFVIGSGNNADYIFDKTTYNEATCETMIKVIYKLDKDLEAAGLDLNRVVAVAGVDSTSTVASFGGNLAGTTTAKTGTVSAAKTLAGQVSTKNGDIYFAVLMHTDSMADSGAALQTIKNKVSKLITDNGGAKKVKYEEIKTLPFDKNSVFMIDGGQIGKGS